MNRHENDSHPPSAKEPNQEQKQSSGPIEWDPESTISSKQIAENLNSILRPTEKKHKSLYLSLVNYFNLEAEIFPKKYSKDEYHSIIDASSEAIKMNLLKNLISVYLKKTFALRTRAKNKNKNNEPFTACTKRCF